MRCRFLPFLNLILQLRLKKVALCLLLPLIFFHCAAQKTETLNIYFKFGRYQLDFESKNKLDSFILNHATLKIQIEAHCDSFGSNAYNDALSLKRATQVKEYLISRHLSGDSISVKGFGKRTPLNHNENAKARALNRRAELTWITSAPDTISKISPQMADTTSRLAISPDAGVHSTDTSSLNLKDVDIGSTVRLENLIFFGGRHYLLPESEKVLQKVLNTMNANPSLEIEIDGHICCLGGNGDGMDFDTRTKNLSVNRAKMVYDYLIAKGINQNRLSYKGFGASRKLYQETDEPSRSLNRRVEIKILKK